MKDIKLAGVVVLYQPTDDDIKNITKLDVSSLVSKEINQFLDEYYQKYTGLYLKSKDFVKRINQLVEG